MFWKFTGFSASSPVDSVLDKENFTLEELMDEEEIIQECKALNGRLINFLRDRVQVVQLLRYIIEEPPEDADSKQTFKFPFIACEIFSCEIDVIFKTLVEEEELMDLLFSFLEPNRPHGALLAGYFSKVVICLMVRKTVPLMNYVQAHQDVLCKLVDLIGITSITEVLVRLLGADDHIYPNSVDLMQWLADSDLLEMIVDKLSPFCLPEEHANAAETLSAITRNAPSSPLATKFSSPSFVARIFGHALEDSQSKSGLVHSLSVCISLLDPKRSVHSSFIHSFRSQHMYELPVNVNPGTVHAVIPGLGDLLMILNLSSDEKILPTTYGELRPPLGKHRLKIVEFIAVLLKTGNEVAEKDLISTGTIHKVLDLFFQYPYNNALHHHVENIIFSCLESKRNDIIDHLLKGCNLIGKILQTEKHSILSSDPNQPTLPAAGKQALRAGNIGHITRISNKLVQLGNNDSHVQAHLKENIEWNEWQATVLQDRNMVENVSEWACGRPIAFRDRTRDSDEDDIHDRDYDVTALANNLSQAFRYTVYDNENAEEGHGTPDRDDEDVYFDDESAEVVISSLRLGDDHGSLFTNSNWFAFQDDRIGDASMSTSPSEMMSQVNIMGSSNGGISVGDDEVVIGEDELAESKIPPDNVSTFRTNTTYGYGNSSVDVGNLNLRDEKANGSGDVGFLRFEASDNEDPFGDRPIPEWVAWGDASDFQVGGSSLNPFLDDCKSCNNHANVAEAIIPPVSSAMGEESIPNDVSSSTDSSDGSLRSDPSQRAATVPSLFEEDVEFVGVELEGTEKKMEQALREGIVGEAGPLKRKIIPKILAENSDDVGAGIKEFNDANYWRVEQEVAVLE